MDINSALRECEQKMDKSVEFFQRELRGIRTGRATTSLVDYVKVDYYGSAIDLRELAQVSVPEPTQIVIKPYDPGAAGAIVKAIETADLGFNPMAEGGTIRIGVPPPSKERRRQLVAQVKKMAEDARVAVRNERRDANRQIDQLVQDKSSSVSEDQGKDAKDEIDRMTKKHTDRIDEIAAKKCREIEEN